MINFSEKQKKIVDELKAVNNATNGDVLDKISDEINKLKKVSDGNKVYVGINDVLDIIDKYREDKE